MINNDYTGYPGGSDGKESAGVPGSIPGSGRSSGEGNNNPLQYSYLKNPVDRGDTGYRPRGCKELDTTEWPPHSLMTCQHYIFYEPETPALLNSYHSIKFLVLFWFDAELYLILDYCYHILSYSFLPDLCYKEQFSSTESLK